MTPLASHYNVCFNKSRLQAPPHPPHPLKSNLDNQVWEKASEDVWIGGDFDSFPRRVGPLEQRWNGQPGPQRLLGAIRREASHPSGGGVTSRGLSGRGWPTPHASMATVRPRQTSAAFRLSWILWPCGGAKTLSTFDIWSCNKTGSETCSVYLLPVKSPAQKHTQNTPSYRFNYIVFPE